MLNKLFFGKGAAYAPYLLSAAIFAAFLLLWSALTRQAAFDASKFNGYSQDLVGRPKTCQVLES